MHFIEEQFKNFIFDYRIKYNHENTIKLGILCSGGVDSSVLLNVANKFKDDLNLNIDILHISFNDFISYDKATNLVIKYTVTFNNRINIKNCDLYSLKSKVKETAREYMKNITFESNYDLVLSGHHLDDQIETFFLRILRGSGLHGLKCMDYFSEYHKNNETRLFGKPFINIRKKDLILYATNNNIEYVEDETNHSDHSDDSDRNYIRNKIIPLLENRFNVNNINTLISNINEQLNSYSNSSNNIDIYSGKWPVNDFIKLSIGNKIFVIREYLRTTFGYNLNKNIIDHLKNKLEEDISNLYINLNMGYCLYKDKDYIYIKRVQEAT